MPFGERGGYRPSEELQDQLERAETTLGGKPEHALTPHSQEVGDIFKIPLAEIKKKFARRYEIYLQLLRAQRREDEGEPVLTDENIAQMQKWLNGLNALDRYIAEHKTGETEVLRERQLPIFEDLRNFIEQGGKDGYVKLPTGVGKTVLFTELIEALDFKTLIVVPTTPLIEQTQEQIEEFAPDLEVGKVYAYAKEHGRQVTIITYDSFVSQVRDGKIKPEDYDCLILDEAHTALSTKRSDTVRQFKDALKLGFTATPAYSEKKKVGNLLTAEIHSMSIREAVEEGLLCSFSAMVARTNVDLSKVSLTSAGEYDEHQLAKAVNIASRNQSAVDLYKTTFAGETAVAYCVNIKHAEAVARTFNEQGVRAEVISGNTSRAEQKRIKKEFHEGKIKVLCNADILIPGFDEPRASVCLNLRPTRSRVIAEQRGGRVLRTQRRNPDKHAHIVDFIDQGIDDKRPPILFADVAEGARFMPRDKRATGGDGGGGRPPTPIVDIPGLEVITDMEEVMRIVGKYREAKTRLRKEFLAYGELRTAVGQAMIDSSAEYLQVYKRNKGWPSEPWEIYDEWPGWDAFLGKEKKADFLGFSELKKEVRAAGIKTGGQYNMEYKRHPGWTSDPDKKFSDQWPGWEEFLGTEDRFLSIDMLQKEVRAAGVTSGYHYKAVYKKHAGWPASPDKKYGTEWPGWDAFLGKEARFLSIADLKKEVRANRVSTGPEYKESQKLHPDWPSNPNIYYGEEWPGWPAFLETEDRFLSFVELRQEVREAKVEKKEYYERVRKSHPGWPADPAKKYHDQWPGWKEFLGTEFLSLDVLQTEVRAAGITGIIHYGKVRKSHIGWPAMPSQFYGRQWPGWDTLLGREQKFLSFVELQEDVHKAGIKDSVHYHDVYKNHPRWAGSPHQVYADQWPGWREFLGTEFISFENLRDEVRKERIDDSGQYAVARSRHPSWPSRPDKSYPYKWSGWPEFLGKKK